MLILGLFSQVQALLLRLGLYLTRRNGATLSALERTRSATHVRPGMLKTPQLHQQRLYRSQQRQLMRLQQAASVLAPTLAHAQRNADYLKR
jgi:hypothetical protein